MTALDEFKSALRECVSPAFDDPAIPDTAVTTLLDRLDQPTPLRHADAVPNPLAGTFSDGLEGARARCKGDGEARLLHALGSLSPGFGWFRRPSEPGEAFFQGHANAEIIGHRGIADGGGLTVGLTVMVPGLTYPDHHHPPEEIYLVLSPGAWRQNDDPWWEPGFGGYVYNPPDITHAMRSSDSPLLAIWCLNH